MRVIAVVLVAMIIFFMTTCASTDNQSYNGSMSSWRGFKIHELIDSWGKPYAIIPDAYGNTTYIFVNKSIQVLASFDESLEPMSADYFPRSAQRYAMLACTT